MLNDYERLSLGGNGHDSGSSWILTGILFFGLFVLSPREDRLHRRTADGAVGGWALRRCPRRAQRGVHHGNGDGERAWETRAGAIPKRRPGRYLPFFSGAEPHRREGPGRGDSGSRSAGGRVTTQPCGV